MKLIIFFITAVVMALSTPTFSGADELELKRKELELRERELAIRERELELKAKEQALQAQNTPAQDPVDVESQEAQAPVPPAKPAKQAQSVSPKKVLSQTEDAVNTTNRAKNTFNGLKSILGR